MPESSQDVNQAGVTLSSGNTSTRGSAASSSHIVSSAQLLAQRRQRLTSAKYYDIASTLLGGDSDLNELFLAAARDGDYDKIEYFLQGRTDVIVSIDVKDKRTGNTPLIWAVKKGHIKIVHLLLKHGADPTLRNYEDQTALEVAIPSIKTVLLDCVEKMSYSPHRMLLQAAWQGNAKVVQKLLMENKVIDINCQNAEGLTPLLLLTRDMQLFERISTQLHRPYSPVHVLQELLSNRANVHATDDDDKTCLHYASQSKAMLAQSVVNLLINKGSCTDAPDKRHFMPIHLASKSGNTNVIMSLVEGGSEVNSRGYAGLTPLHITAYNDHHQAAKMLLQHGADVTLTDDSGMRAVDLAKSRKMKTTLKEAWTEAEEKKQPTNLSPVRAPSREHSRLSSEGSNKKRTGEVIFDGLQIHAVSSQGSISQRSILTRSLSNAEKARKAEQQMLRDIESGRFTPTPKDNFRKLGQLRNKPPPIPQISQSSNIPSSPDSLSPATPGLPKHVDDVRRSLEDGRHMCQKGQLTILSASSSALSSCKDKDVSFCIKNNRQHSHIITEDSKEKKHKRSGSDPFTACIGDVASSCDQYLSRKARSHSTSSYEETDDDPLKMMPLDRELTGLNIPSTIPEVNSPRVTAVIMGAEEHSVSSSVIPIYPNSSRVLPPTPVPTFLTQKSFSLLDGKLVRSQEKELSPRSNDELPKILQDPVKAVSGNSLLRSHSIFKEEFILEESRPKDPLLQSSGSDPMSSPSSLSSSSPRDMTSIILINKNAVKIAKGRMSPLITCDSKQISACENTADSGQQNGIKTRSKVGRSQSFNTAGSKSASARKFSVPDSVTVHKKHISPGGMESSNSAVKVKFSRSDSELHKQLENAVPQNGKNKFTKTRHSTPASTEVLVSQNCDKTHVKDCGAKSKTVASETTGKENIKSLNINLSKNPQSNSCVMSKNKESQVSDKSADTKTSDKNIVDKKQTVTSKNAVTNKPSNNDMKVSSNSATSNNSLKSKTSDKNDKDKQQITSKNLATKSSDISNAKKSGENVAVRKSSDSKVYDNKNSPLQPAREAVIKTETKENSADQKKDTKLEKENVSYNAEAKNNDKIVKGYDAVDKDQKKDIKKENNTQNISTFTSQNLSKSSGTTQSISFVSKKQIVPSKSTQMTSITNQNKTKFVNASKKVDSTNSLVKTVVHKTQQVVQVSVEKKSQEKEDQTKPAVEISSASTIVSKREIISSKSPKPAVVVPKAGVTNNANNVHSSVSNSNSVPTFKTGPHVPKRDPGGVVTKTVTTTANSVPVTSTIQTQNSPTTVSQNSKFKSSDSAAVNLQPKTSTSIPSQSQKSSAPNSKSFESAKKSASNLISSIKNSVQMKNVKSSVTSDPNSKSEHNKLSDHHQFGHVSSTKVNKGEATPASNKTDINSKITVISSQHDLDAVKNKPVSTPKEPLVKILLTGEEPKPRISNIPSVNPFPSETIQTPLIVNPFEDFALPDYNIPTVKPAKIAKGVPVTSFGYVVGKSTKDATCRYKTASKSRVIKSAKKTQSSKDSKRPVSSNRQPSARRRGAKSKPGEQEEAHKVKSAKGKRLRSGRRKKSDQEPAELNKNALNHDVAVITGIGWHVTTDCFDTSDVKVAKMIDLSDSEDSDVSVVELIKDEDPYFKLKPKLTDRSASPSTPRFQEVKMKPKQKSLLPIMTNDGFPPMNLDMTQEPLPGVQITEATTSSVNKKPNSKENKFSSKMDDITDEVHKKTMLKKINSIPQSPTLVSTTVNAIHYFDQTVTGEQLDELLGINPDETILSSHSAIIKQGLRNEAPSGKKHSSTMKKKADGKATSNSQSLVPENEGKTTASMDLNKDISNSEEDKNNLLEPALNREPSEEEITKIIKKYASLKHTSSKPSRERNDAMDNDDFMSKRCERKFSETKREQHENDSEIDEAIEEILNSTAGTSTLNSTLRSNRTVKSVNSTLTEADMSVLLQLKQTDSVFHAKQSHDDVHQTETSVDETNLNLLKRFHDDNFKMGSKLKAMIDADADESKVKAMINADDEHKQLEKVMNCVRNMELQVTMTNTSGKTSSNVSPQKIPVRSEQTMESPHKSKKPPSCHGLPPLFKELKKANVQKGRAISEHEDQSPRIGNKEEAVLEAISKEIIINPSEGETMCSHLRGRRGSRTSSAGTVDSIASDSDEMIEWKKGNVLGRGAFGVVWCGLTNEGELIAVKQIELNAADHSKAQREYEKVQEEVELLKNLRHKNIVGYLGTSFENDIVSIFMQFVPGGSIASILARFGALDESVFRRYTKQILEGVEYLHENDIIHRDIKGGNVMLMPNGVIKLIDFGCAKRLCINLSLSQSQILKSMKGTPYWMAPEVVNETGHGKKSDIWSVGCTVFEMATKKPPWANVNPLAAIFAIGSNKPIPPLPEQFSADARNFVESCLTRDQNKRLSASELLQHPFILKKSPSRK